MRRSRMSGRIFLAGLLALLALPATAATYTLKSGWLGGDQSTYPPCNGGSWSYNDSTKTHTCSGSISLAYGDTITAQGSARTLVAQGGITLAGNNTIGSSTYAVNLQSSWGGITSQGSANTVYGNVTAGSGAISLANTTVTGNVSSSGTVNLNGGTVSGSVSGNNGVTANGATLMGDVSASNGSVSLSGAAVGGNVNGANGVTSNATTIAGSLAASNGSITLISGSVGGGVSSNCCSVTTTGTNITGGVRSTSNSVSLDGGTVSGAIASGGGAGVQLNGVTMPSGSITASNVPITINGSTLGSATSTVNVTGNNTVSLTGNTTVYGNVTAGNWSGALSIDGTSQVSGMCTPNHPRCNQSSLLNCPRPADAPSDVSCICDTFDRSSLNPSPLFNANWILNTSDSTGLLPSIVGNRLRLTANTTNNAKSATVPAVFPAAGNYFSIDFDFYAYNGNGADGVAVVFSDYTVPAKAGAYGGSLGYAQRTGIDGFAGGWLGVGLDEYGNFYNDNEGRGDGGSPTQMVPDSVTVRGSGNGQVGYLWHASSGTLTPGVDASGATPAPGHHYRIIVDHSDSIHAWTQVDRNTGSGYVSIVPRYDAKAKAGQAAVPANWQISFTGSTGSAYNIHEIDNLRICARRVYPPSGGTASGFAAIDEAYGDAGGSPKPANQQYQTGHIYTKLMGVAFQLNVAAMDALGNVQSGYGVSSNKYLKLTLVDNSDGVCKLRSSDSDYCNAACIGKSAVPGGAQVLTFASGNAGQVRSGSFTLNTAYKNLVAVMRECTTSSCTAWTSTAPACSVDAFAVRPTAVSALAATATSGVTGTNRFEAGGSFTLTATIAGISAYANGYAGTLKINPSGIVAASPATVTGNLAGQFAAALSGTPTATASGSNFTYSEVGSFVVRGYDPASDAASPRGVYDGALANDDNTARAAAWTGVDAVDTANDCIAGSFANVKDANGKYGCNFGPLSDTTIGPFVPHHFQTDVQPACGGFTYSGQPFGLRVTAQNAGGERTQNYDKDSGFSRQVTLSDANAAAGTFAPASLAASEFTKGVLNRQYDAGTPTVSFTYSQKQAGPSVVQVRAVDTDLVSSRYGTEGKLDNMRSGRLRLANVYGYASPLAMPLEVQYWSGNSWITNVDDACTAAKLAVGNVAAPGWTVNGLTLSGGRGAVTLTPNAPGSITVCLDLGPDAPGGPACSATSAGLPWLQSLWPPGAGGNDPYARATFGVFSPESRRGIYNREIY